MKLFYQWRRYLPLFVLSVFFVSSCEKTDTGLSTDKLEYDRWDQLNMSDVLYEQIKYNLVYLDPSSFVSEDKREGFEEVFNLHFEELVSLGYERSLSLFQERGFVSEAYAEELAQSLNTIQRSIRGVDYIDFASVLGTIDQESDEMKNNLALTLEERKIAVSKLSVLKGVVQYFSEIYPSGTPSDNSVELRSCNFGERLACIIQGTVIGVLTGGVAALIDNFDTATPIPQGSGQVIGVSFDGGSGLIIAGGIAGFIYGAVRGNCCEPEYECYFIEGVSTRFSSCEPVAEYTAFGFGDQAEDLNWNNDNGIPMSVITPVANPRTTITQINNNTAVETIVTTVCDDGTEVTGPRSFMLNLFQRSRSISDFYLAGQDQIYPGETYLYTGIGGGVEANYDIRWFVNGGVVLSTGNRNATIRWNEGIEDGWVQMEVRNRCSGGAFRLFTLNVTGDGPIP